jgi:hypothetical protein
MSEPTPNGNRAEPLSGRERAEIVLHEYDGLRAEITSRTGNMFQLFAMVIIVVGWVATSHHVSLFWRLVLAGLLLTAVGGFLLIMRDMTKAAKRIREIEGQVDQDTGEWYLLRWERLWGSSKTGYLSRARPLDVPDDPRQMDRST